MISIVINLKTAEAAVYPSMDRAIKVKMKHILMLHCDPHVESLLVEHCVANPNMVSYKGVNAWLDWYRQDVWTCEARLNESFIPTILMVAEESGLPQSLLAKKSKVSRVVFKNMMEMQIISMDAADKLWQMLSDRRQIAEERECSS